MVVELEIKKGWFTGIAANNREGDGIIRTPTETTKNKAD
jgi:hypothetical protein